jgi:hypothetical protein
MKDPANGLTVEFMLQETEAQATSADINLCFLHHPMTCPCGSHQFVLANVLKADTIKGIPASSMYECISCGEYRLG